MHTDDDRPLTEADVTSHTRFGPRPVPKGHRTSSRFPRPATKSSRIIPTAPMSPDGRSAYPTPSLSTKIVVWGGVALGVAGATAGAITAARKIAGMIESDPPKSRPRSIRNETALAPRFTDRDEEEREAIRRRARQQAREDSEEVARLRAEAARRRNPPKRGNVAKDLTRTATDLSSGLEGVARSLSSAFDAFRGVASQASGIVAEFALAADAVRNALHGDGKTATKPDASVPRGDDASRPHRL